MARNYTGIHYIQEHLAEFHKDFRDAVIRAFCGIHDSQSGNECVSLSACLFIIARKYGYDPELCYGLCEMEGHEFYHAWIEIDGTIIDIAIYGNVNFSPYSLCERTMETPFIGSYEEAPLRYGKYQFDEDWKAADISFIHGKTLEQYMDGLSEARMWKFLCKLLGVTPTKHVVDELRTFTDGVLFDKP